uniref:Msx2-interacting protein n=1 Tax=Loa loa TaxID=7209 RepID=A0A1I7VHJ2_LOALO
MLAVAVRRSIRIDVHLTCIHQIHPHQSRFRKNGKTSQHRLSSSRRQSRERERDRERGNSSRTDERSQRSRTSGNNDRRMGASDSRPSRRSRHSPRASASSDSSRDSVSPSGSSGHYHHASNTHTVQSTVIKLGTPSSRRNDTNSFNELSSTCGTHDSLSGIYVSNLPSSRTEGFLRDGLTNFFKKFGKVVHIMFETESGPNFVEQRRALVIFQRLMDADKLKDNHHMFGLRLKIRFASHATVTEAYSTYLVTNGQACTRLQECLSSQDTASTSSSSAVDALANRASRTLYVGGLERRTTDDSLRSRFSCFGHILETEVKNWESPSPFAFIQFADIQSVVCAINAYAQSTHSSGGKGKLKMNWGRTIVSNKIWIGELPSSCSADYLREKIRVSFTDTFNEVIYDPRHREALLLFSNNDSAQKAFSMIKTKQVAFWNADEKKDVHVPVDYCSEKLHDYFVDRKFRGESGNALVNGNGPGSCTGNSTLACSSGGLAIASTSASSLLAPPPDPPSHLRDTSSRTDGRRSSSSMASRRRRSDEREGCRTSSRSLRYSSYNRSRRRRERARRNDVSPSSSSTSSTSSDSDLSSSSTPDRKRTGTGHSKTNIQRLHKDKTPVCPSSSRQPNSPSSGKPDRNFERSNSITGITLQTVANRSSSRASLAQLLPPPMPSAPILNPVMISTPNEMIQQQEYHHSSMSSTSLSVDSGLPYGANGKSTAEQRNRKAEQQQTDAKRLDNKGSHVSGLYNPAMQGNFTANELSAITSNRIEEIANTLVNVLQHHSKASTSTTASAPLAVMSGTHQNHSSTCSTQRSADDFCDSSRHHSSRLSASFAKRTKWPWGNDPIKNHCAIPLDGSANRSRDPRYRKYSPQTSTVLPLPKFVHERRSTPSSCRSSVPDPFRSPQQQKQDSRCLRNSLPASSSSLAALNSLNAIAGCSLKWSAAENSPPQKATRGRTHSSVSRSESSNSEAMLSPDPSNSTTQTSLVTGTIDIFGDTSPSNNSSAYRERLDALGATFQNIEQKFQKTKQNTHLEYDRKGPLQRSYKFEEELERLKARTGSSSSTVTTSQSVTTTCSTTCSHPTSNTFTDSFTRVRSGCGTTSVFDSKDTESQKLIRTPLSISIPMPPAPLASTSSSPYTTVFYTTCISSSSLSSPQFSGTQIKKPIPSSNITQSSNQTPSSTAARIAYPPDFSVPPPPLPQPPVPPTLSLTAYKSAATGTSLISAPPPPPPLTSNNSTSYLLDPTSSCLTTSLQSLTRSAVPQSGVQSSSWRTAAKPSTPPPPASHSSVSSKQTSVSSVSSTPKPSTSGSASGGAVLEMDKMRSRTQGTEKVQMREKEHLKIGSKSHLPEKKVSKDLANKQPSLSELFRQQAQDSSEVLKKQLKKVKKEKSDEPSHHRSNDESKKGITESTKGKHSKENEKKLPEKSDQNVAEKEKDKHADGKGQSQEAKLKTANQKQLKEKKEKELREKDKEHEGGEPASERKKTQRPMEKSIKNKSVKDGGGIKQKEKVKEKEQLQKYRSKKRQEEERCKQKEKEKEQRKKELTKKRKRKRESSTSSSEEASSSEVELHSFDRELKRLFMEEEASGSLGLSMYDRVKQRSSSKPDDAARKNRALELLQERTQNRRNNEQNRPKRVQLESSSSDEKKGSSNDDESDNSSGPSIDTSKARKKKKKTEPKGKAAKKAKSLPQKKLRADDETEYNDDGDNNGNDDDDDDDDDGVGKDSERSESEEDHSKRKRSRKGAGLKIYKKQKKTMSLSLDDVFGTYSTDDESTKHSKGSIVPSLYKEKDEKENGKKAITKSDENQKSKNEKEKIENTKRLTLKKERKKEKLDESDGGESGAEGKKVVPRKTESKQIFERSVERKVTGRKRFGISDEVSEATTVNTVLPEKKKQKAEKSLVVISMFREEDKRLSKVQAPITLEQKRKSQTPGTSRQFEKKLAKKLKREQKERHEEQKREAAETKQKDEKLQNETQRQKVNRADSGNSDGAGVSGISSLNDRNSETVVQSHESSSTKCVRKRHFKAENSEKVKKSREEPKSPKTDVSETISDSCQDLKRKAVVVVKQEPSNKSPEKIAVNNVRDDISGPESKSGSPSDRRNTALHLPQSVKTTVPSVIPAVVEVKRIEVDCISEECATNTTLHTMANEYHSPRNKLHDESNRSSKYGSMEQKLETDGSSVVADNIVVSRHFPEEADLDQNRLKQQEHQELCTSDDEGGGGGNIDRNVVGRKNSVSSTNSSESGQTSLLSTSSANLETQLEDGPEDQEQQQILESEKIRISGSVEVLKSGGICSTEQEFVEKTENEEKLSSNDMVIQLSTSEQVIVPNSDAECSTDPIVHSADVVNNALTKQQQQPQNVEGSGVSILDSANDVESNGSFELIDEGRVGDVDSLPDQDIDGDIGSMRQQHCRESTYEVGHIQNEAVMEAEEEHADDSECVATVRAQNDVHDVQETEFAVQSIVLDDSRSQHSGEDSSAAMDYLSEGVGGSNSRRGSLNDSATMANMNLNANKQQEENNSQHNADDGNGDSITSKSAADTERQDMQSEGTDDGKGKMDVDKRSDSHLDEVIDDVVAGGYMEVDAEQLMRINSKKAKEEAVLRAAAASTQGSINAKVMPSISFSRDAETSQYDYQNAAQGSSHIQQQQYGSSGYHVQQSQQHQQPQMPQQIPLQQDLLSKPLQQQLQQNVIHGNSHVVLQQQPQQQQHMGQVVMQQQQHSRLTSYQQSQSQIMKVPETTYLQPQHLPPIEQRVQGTTAISQQQQPHPLQSQSVTTGSLPSYYPGRNAVQHPGTASFASPQMSLQQQQQQQQHLFLQQQQTTDNMQNITNTVSTGAVHAVSQLPDVCQQVVQTASSQQQTTQLVAQSHVQHQQSINYGSPMMTATCNAATVVAAQTVSTASRQLDLNKQIGLSTAPFQESISSSPYDLYANLPRKPSSGVVQSQHQQQ